MAMGLAEEYVESAPACPEMITVSGLPLFLLRHALIGFAIGMVFVIALLWLDLGGLRSLLLRDAGGWLAAGLLVFFAGSTFAAVQMGMAVMLSGGTDED